MADDVPLWRRMAERHGLVERDLDRFASPWHTDGDLGRPIELVADTGRSRRFGFACYRATDDAFLDLFAELHAKRIIPGPAVH